jgi:hypothetical protein
MICDVYPQSLSLSPSPSTSPLLLLLNIPRISPFNDEVKSSHKKKTSGKKHPDSHGTFHQLRTYDKNRKQHEKKTASTNPSKVMIH